MRLTEAQINAIVVRDSARWHKLLDAGTIPMAGFKEGMRRLAEWIARQKGAPDT